jgi:hypothetical protein
LLVFKLIACNVCLDEVVIGLVGRCNAIRQDMEPLMGHPTIRPYGVT